MKIVYDSFFQHSRLRVYAHIMHMAALPSACSCVIVMIAQEDAYHSFCFRKGPNNQSQNCMSGHEPSCSNPSLLRDARLSIEK